MGLELRAGETSTAGAQRVLLERIDCALHYMHSKRALGDRAVHAARKELKRARSALKLWRDGMSATAYRRENAVLRAAGKPLTHVRDAKVMLDTLAKLVAHYPEAARGLRLQAFRARLRSERVALRRSLLQVRRVLVAVGQSLQECSRRVANLPVQEDAWEVYGRGLQRAYRKGRRGFMAARRDPAPLLMHEWRKSAKRLRHQLQVLQPAWPGVIGELADQAQRLTEYLGEDHDLCLLREKISHHADAFNDGATAGALQALIDRRRAELHDRAFALGERLYGEKPGEFDERFGQYWLDWCAETSPLAGRSHAGRRSLNELILSRTLN